MEEAPREDEIPEEIMRTWGLEADDSYLDRNRGEVIKSIYCHDGDGNPCFTSLGGESLADGPTVSGPFNPQDN
jgi:hypothetical protein